MKDTGNKIELTYDDKIAALKKMHQGSHPEAKAQIDKWGDELSRLKLESDWLNHPNTQSLRVTLTEQLQRIVSVLADDETLKEEDRKVYFKSKEVIYALLALVSRDPEQEMKSIQQQIDSEL